MTTPQKVDLARRIVKLERGLKNLPAAGHSAVVELAKLSLKDLRSRLKAAEANPAVGYGPKDDVQPEGTSPEDRALLDNDAEEIFGGGRIDYSVWSTPHLSGRWGDGARGIFFDVPAPPSTGPRAKVKAARKQRNAQGRVRREAKRHRKVNRMCAEFGRAEVCPAYRDRGDPFAPMKAAG